MTLNSNSYLPRITFLLGLGFEACWRASPQGGEDDPLEGAGVAIGGRPPVCAWQGGPKLKPNEPYFEDQVG